MKEMKEVTDYFVQVAGTADGRNYMIATHETGERPDQLYHPGRGRGHLSTLGGTYIPGGSTAVSLVYADGSAQWIFPIVKVSGADGWFFLSTLTGYFGTLVVTINQHAPSAFVLRVA